MTSTEPGLVLRVRRLRAARGVVVAPGCVADRIQAAYLAAQEAVGATWAEVAPDDAASAVQGPFWLSELRPAAPESAGTRILFTVEPSGTAVLLAAGTESDRLQAWYAEAIAWSRLRYQRTRRR